MSPGKKPWVAFGSGLLGILLLVSLIDYNPSNFHSSPPAGSSPLLGQMGVNVARFLYGILGIAAWLLPWLFGTISFLWSTRPPTREKIRKIATIAVAIVSIAVLANVRHYALNPEDRQTDFPPDLYEHGAGGSIGAILYSGMPWLSSPEDVSGGFFLVWMGALGTSILMACLLVASLCIHFSMEPHRNRRGRLVGVHRFSGTAAARLRHSSTRGLAFLCVHTAPRGGIHYAAGDIRLLDRCGDGAPS